jgi:paraquat-inducible protein B
VSARSRWSRLPLVWILPAVVILAGAFVVIHEKLAQGTSIEIRFHNAEDLEADKTKIRYKDVEIGEVSDIHVSKDRKEVVVTADHTPGRQEYLVSDTRFWVVRPEVSAAGVTGLGNAGLGRLHQRRCGKLHREQPAFHRTRGAADRHFRPARPRIRAARG